MRILYLLFLIGFTFSSTAQTNWSRIYGGPNNNFFRSVCEANDGGYLMVGNTYTYGALSYLGSTLGNVYVVKSDQTGNLQWQKTISLGFYSKFGYDIIQVPNGDIFIVGIEKNMITQDDVFIVKLDSSGNEMWYQTYGGSLNDNARNLVADGNDVVFAGTFNNSLTGQDVWISKVFNSGFQAWSKTYHLDASEIGNSICKVHDGGFLVCGQYLSSTNIYTGLAMRFNSSGDTLWSRILNGTGSSIGSNTGFWSCTELLNDTIFIVTGSTPQPSYGKLNAVRLDMNGTVISMYVSGLLADIGTNVKPLPDGGYIIAGQYANFGQEGALYRFSANGGFQWFRKYFDLGSQSYPLFSYIGSVINASDGGFIIAGYVTIFNNASKAFAMKVDHLGIETSGPVITPAINGNVSFCEGSTTIVSVPDSYDHYQWFWYNSNNQITWIPESDTSSITVDSSRYYRCTMWNENGEIAISGNASVIVSVWPDSLITSTGPLAFCASSSTQLRAHNKLGNNFQWLYNGSPMIGFTNYNLTPQVSGNYSVQITNACTTIVSSIVQVTVNGPPRLKQTVTTSNLSFFNGGISSCNTAYLSVSTIGTGSTGHEWYYNGIPTGTTTSNFNAKKAGYYNVLAQSACGAGWSDTAWVVYDTIFSPLGHSGSLSLTGCANSNLQLYVQNNTGQLPQAYDWFKDGQWIGTGSSSYNPASYSAGLDSGYYYCLLGGLCLQNSSHTDSVYYREENSSRQISFPGGTASSCLGSPITIQTIQVGLFYQWYKDSILIVGATSQSFSVAVTGSYYCSVTVACGTYTTNPAFIAIGPPVPTITSSYAGLCRTEVDTIKVRLQVVAGVQASYKWRLNGVIIPGATTTYYETKISGIYDCIFSYSCDTLVSNAIQLNDEFISRIITRENSGRFCPGGTVNLKATPGFTYQWQTGNQPIPGATDSIYTTSVAGTFNVKISNGLCTINTLSASSSEQPVATPNYIMPTTPLSFCGINPVLLKANTRPDFTYQWFQNGQLIPGATQSEYYASGQGDFQVSLTDSISCVNLSPPVSTNNLTFNNVALNIGSGLNICLGDTTVISVNGTYSTYQWFHNGVPISGVTSGYIETDSTGLYKVTVTDSLGCSGSAQTQLNIVTPMTYSIFSATPSSCQASTGKILISFFSLMNVSWSGPSNINPCVQVNSCNPTNLLPGWYYVNYSPFGGGCSMYDSIEVLSTPDLYVSINAGTGTICEGKTITAGTGYPQYLWSTGQTSFSTAPPSTGWYYLTVTDAVLGCSGVDSSFIIVNPAPIVDIQITGPPIICSGAPIQLDAGSGFSQYLWSLGITSQVISASNSGTYIVTVTEPVNGCTNKDTVIISASVTPVASLSPSGFVDLCQGDSILISATPGYSSYNWSNGATSSSIIANTTGTYVVTVSDLTGLCTITDSLIVNIHSFPSITVSALGSTSFCVGDSVAISITGSTGSYQWYRYAIAIAGATGNTIFATSRGGYKCMITDIYGCSSYSNSITIYTPCQPPQNPIEKEINISVGTETYVRVYPNPTSNIFLIEVSEGLIPSDIRIFDSSGRQVQIVNGLSALQNNLYQCDLEGAVDGVYFIQIIDDSHSIHRVKIVKI